MMSLVIGLSNLAIGLAYAGLGALSAWETITLHRYRGWSRFGIGFSLMAASCGPHHLVHGWHVLQGESISWPMFAVTLIGLPAGLIFVLLRLETMWGGQGERLVAASPHRAVLLAGAFTVVAGWLAAWAFAQPEAGVLFQAVCTSAGLAASATAPEAGIDFASVGFLANVFVTVTYGMVGWYLADHQVRRHLASGAWSLSGVALTGVFFTCAQMHLIDATAHGNGLMLLFDLIGIPASIYFLWVVKQVHSDSVLDWNRRPLVGAAAAPARPSPWSGASTRH
jgi:hypothetical protein